MPRWNSGSCTSYGCGLLVGSNPRLTSHSRFLLRHFVLFSGRRAPRHIWALQVPVLAKFDDFFGTFARQFRQHFNIGGILSIRTGALAMWRLGDDLRLGCRPAKAPTVAKDVYLPNRKPK
jgi:hypothetical protein